MWEASTATAHELAPGTSVCTPVPSRLARPIRSWPRHEAQYTNAPAGDGNEPITRPPVTSMVVTTVNTQPAGLQRAGRFLSFAGRLRCITVAPHGALAFSAESPERRIA